MDGEQLELIEDGKVATIRARSLEEAELTDTTCTPKWVADLLPHRDLDPFSNARSHIRADRALSLENGDNGLIEPWLTLDGQPCTAFQNHPFSSPDKFVAKAHYEMKIGRCVDLIVLCKDDPSTDWHDVLTSWYPDAPRGHVLSRPPEMWRFNNLRIQYDEHPTIIERRRLEKIAKARIDGWSEKRIAKITGKSQANFVSVIYHFRGWYPFRTTLNGWDRRPKLDLERVATRWVQEN